MTLPLHLPSAPLAPVPLAPVPLAPVPLAPVPVAASSLGSAFQEPESRPGAAAIIEFRGFPSGPLGAPPRDLLLVDAGDPQQAARWFATALASAAEPAQFAVACLRTAPARLGPAPLGPAPLGPARLGPLGEERWDGKVAYRYRLALAPAGGAGLRLQCWRYYGEQIGWQRRCGPMALGAFVAHFGAQGAAVGFRA